MNLVLDVHYPDPAAISFGSSPPFAACGAALLFEAWEQHAHDGQIVQTYDDVVPYESGAFYRREMPILLDLIERMGAMPSCVVVDGYTWLGGLNETDAKPGLGAHLWEALGRQVPVIGVAKNAFGGTPAAQELRRGSSQRALYVSAAGMDHEHAVQRIAGMHGVHRLPTLLNRVDRLCRDGGDTWLPTTPPSAPHFKATAPERGPTAPSFEPNRATWSDVDHALDNMIDLLNQDDETGFLNVVARWPLGARTDGVLGNDGTSWGLQQRWWNALMDKMTANRQSGNEERALSVLAVAAGNPKFLDLVRCSAGASHPRLHPDDPMSILITLARHPR